jgi:RimJ/RimL family protein N-acetyltransferase
MINTRVLTESDSESLDKLIKTIESGIERKEWWMPITKKARSMFFDGKSAVLLGAFNEDNELVGACGLFFFEVLSETNVSTLNANLAEIGRCMVLQEYRGNNLMLRLNQELVEIAKSLGKRNIVATSHPDNKASCRSLEQLGFTKKCLVRKWNNYSRNYYTYNIKDYPQSKKSA